MPGDVIQLNIKKISWEYWYSHVQDLCVKYDFMNPSYDWYNSFDRGLSPKEALDEAILNLIEGV